MNAAPEISRRQFCTSVIAFNIWATQSLLGAQYISENGYATLTKKRTNTKIHTICGELLNIIFALY